MPRLAGGRCAARKSKFSLLRFDNEENMAKKMFIFYLIILSVITIVPRSYDSISASDLCDVEGYTIVDCTYTKRKGYDDESSDDIVRLDNGMIFRISGYIYSLSSSRAVVFAKKFTANNNAEIISYKLFIDDKDRIYSASRIR
jgi:hypothetical protein